MLAAVEKRRAIARSSRHCTVRAPGSTSSCSCGAGSSWPTSTVPTATSRSTANTADARFGSAGGPATRRNCSVTEKSRRPDHRDHGRAHPPDPHRGGRGGGAQEKALAALAASCPRVARPSARCAGGDDSRHAWSRVAKHDGPLSQLSADGWVKSVFEILQLLQFVRQFRKSSKTICCARRPAHLWSP